METLGGGWGWSSVGLELWYGMHFGINSILIPTAHAHDSPVLGQFNGSLLYRTWSHKKKKITSGIWIKWYKYNLTHYLGNHKNVLGKYGESIRSWKICMLKKIAYHTKVGWETTSVQQKWSDRSHQKWMNKECVRNWKFNLCLNFRAGVKDERGCKTWTLVWSNLRQGSWES